MPGRKRLNPTARCRRRFRVLSSQPAVARRQATCRSGHRAEPAVGRTRKATALRAGQCRLAERIFHQFVPDRALCGILHRDRLQPLDEIDALEDRRRTRQPPPPRGAGRTTRPSVARAPRATLQLLTCGCPQAKPNSRQTLRLVCEICGSADNGPPTRCSASGALRRCLTRFCVFIASWRMHEYLRPEPCL